MTKIILNLISFVFIALVTLTAAPQPAVALDARQLYKWKPSQYKSGTAFCKKWDSTCKSLHPKHLHYVNYVCEPGDYQGKNTSTEAKAACVYDQPGKPQQIENKEVAKKLHVQLV